MIGGVGTCGEACERETRACDGRKIGNEHLGGGGGARGRPFVVSFDGITTVVIVLFVCLKLAFCQWYTYQRVAVTMPIPVILVED